MNLVDIKKIAETEMGDKRSSPYNERGDKFAHGERVAKLAIRLRELILPNDNSCDDVLMVAAWFHDICNGFGDRAEHAVSGVERTKELLRNNCSQEELDKITGIIAVHDDRKPDDNTHSAIIKIHQDADLIDHFGTLDIWRFVAYAIGHGETISEAICYMQNEWPDLLKRWRKELHFDLSKKIFDDRVEFARLFIERFAVEGAGEIWNENTIVTEE